MGKEREDLSRAFRRAYTAALFGGSAMTLLATATTFRDIDGLRDRLGDDPTFDQMMGWSVFRSGATITLLLLLWWFLLRPMADRLAFERGRLLDAEAELRAIVARQDLHARVVDAFEMAYDEQAVHLTMGRAMAEVAPDSPAELLLADSSRAHLVQVATSPTAGAPGCSVASPWSCPAIRRGRTTVFQSSRTLGACPELARRGGDPRSATCVPVSFMGRNLGVLHLTGPEGQPPAVEATETLAAAANLAGERIGVLRAFAKAQLQAATDSLTGLANRRAITEQAARLLRRRDVVSIVLVDLDHFKQVNDTFGHDTGDRALRAFADVALCTLRDEDLIGRWGGEEFLIVLPGLERHDAVPVLDRLRAALAEAVDRADLPAITASMGVIDSTATLDLEEAIRLADEALLAAKAQGRDRIVVGPVVLDPAAARAEARARKVGPFPGPAARRPAGG